MTSRKWTKLIEGLVANLGGGRVEQTNGGHIKVMLDGVAAVVIISATPSDGRALKNIESDLKRAKRGHVQQRHGR